MLDLEFEILYDLSLSVGGSLDLESTLRDFTTKALRLLDRRAGAVLRESGCPRLLPHVEYALPSSFPRPEELKTLAGLVDFASLARADELVRVVVDTKDPQRVFHCFRIPGYGFLVLTGRPLRLSETFVRHLHDILIKLAASCHACRLNKDIADKSRRLELATNAASIGVWELEVHSGQLTVDSRTRTLLNVSADTPLALLEDLLALVHAADQPAVQEHLATFIEQAAMNEPTEFFIRIPAPNDRLRKLACRAVLTEQEGGAARLVAVCHDVTDVEHARSESAYRAELERLLVSFSVELVKKRYEDMDDVITRALGQIGEFVGADRAYRFAYDWESETTSNTHEWCGEGVEPAICNLQHVPIRDLRLWSTSHRAGLPFLVRSVNALPSRHGLRTVLEPQGIQSLVTVPLMVNDDCIGFLGLDAVRQERHWSDVDITVLHLLADLLVNADIRSRHERLIAEQHDELIRARNRAEQFALEADTASQAKSRFLARVSHEMRTPLHAILGLTDLSLEDGDAVPPSQSLQTIRDSAQYLLDLINDVLEFSKAESSEVTITERDFDLQELLSGLDRMFRPLAVRKGLSFRIETAPEVRQAYRSDPLRLRQIVTNLLSNAMKFTRAGAVTLTVSTDADRPNFVNFAVRDTGVGIDSEDIDKLFDPFFQCDHNDTLNLSGTGLGLPISRTFAKTLGGEVFVSSEWGKGSVFTLTLPLPVARESVVRVPAQPVVARGESVAGLNILVAEDNPINQQLVRAFLRDVDCHVTCVNNGREACDALDANGEHYHVLLLDCHMPVMDGFQAAREIRASGGRHSAIPIIAVTAGAMEDQKSECLAAGMDEVLTKPFRRADLLDRLAAWAGSTDISGDGAVV